MTNTARLQRLINRQAAVAASQLVRRPAPSRPLAQPVQVTQATPAAPTAQVAQPTQPTAQAAGDQALQRYHSAWQHYYQQYYQNYYIAALQQQQQRFAQQQAAVVDSRETDGKLEQTEVQQRLSDQVLTQVKQTAAHARQQRWFLPAAVAAVVMVVFLFLQYNSVLAAKLAAFVSPGSSSNQTIIVGTGANQPVYESPRIIIPKINVNAPVTYGLTDLGEQAVQTALQSGPVNYPVAGATATPGQKGNTVILGHSSADFFAPGDYKFIFVQLNRLGEGDLFYLDYGHQRYTYKVVRTEVINPTQVDKLNLGTDRPYATLVTCDPPGTIAHRLLVIAEQVSPDPNAASSQQTSESTATTITGKPKTLLESIFGG